MRKITYSKTFFSIIVAGAFLMSSCSQEPEVKPTPKLSFSGEDYFKGLYFLDGAVADKIDVFATMKQRYEVENDATVKQEVEKLSADLIDGIRKQDPSFFTRFSADIESNDHGRIANALKEGGTVMQKSITTLFQDNAEYRQALEASNKIDIKQAVGPDGLVDQNKLQQLHDEFVLESNSLSARQTCVAFNIWFNVNVNINFNLAVNINAAVAINIWNQINIYSDTMPYNIARSKELQNEIVIQQIVDAF